MPYHDFIAKLLQIEDLIVIDIKHFKRTVLPFHGIWDKPDHKKKTPYLLIISAGQWSWGVQCDPDDARELGKYILVKFTPILDKEPKNPWRHPLPGIFRDLSFSYKISCPSVLRTILIISYFTVDNYVFPFIIPIFNLGNNSLYTFQSLSKLLCFGYIVLFLIQIFYDMFLNFEISLSYLGFVICVYISIVVL